MPVTPRQREALDKQKREQRMQGVLYNVVPARETLPTCSWWVNKRTRRGFMLSARAQERRMYWSREASRPGGAGIEVPQIVSRPSVSKEILETLPLDRPRLVPPTPDDPEDIDA
jgi:hypothetical protein